MLTSLCFKLIVHVVYSTKSIPHKHANESSNLNFPKKNLAPQILQYIP